MPRRLCSSGSGRTWSVVPRRLCSSGSGRTCDGVKLVLYYVEFVQAHATKTLTTDGGLIRGVGKCATSLATSFDASMHQGPKHLVATLYPDTVFFLLSPLVSEELLPHPLPLHGDHLHSLRKRDDYNPPPLPLSLSPHTRCRCHRLHSQVRK